MKRFSNLFISVRRSTCFRRFFRPSSGAQNLHLASGSSIGVTLYVQFCANTDGRENRLKHVERLIEINTDTLHLDGCTLRIKIQYL